MYIHQMEPTALPEGFFCMIKPIFTSLIFLVLLVPQVFGDNLKARHEVIDTIKTWYSQQDAKAACVSTNGTPAAKAIRFVSPSDGLVTNYENLQQIALIRHGEPDLVKTGKFSRREAKKFLINYASAGIVVPGKRFFSVGEGEEVTVFASPLKRALATAQYIFGKSKEMTISPDFREFEATLGHYSPKLRLSIKVWTTIARVKWILGIDRQGIESFSQARERAQKVAELLAQTSERQSKVALVAHGFLNRYVKKELEKMGWHEVRNGGAGYLATSILVKVDKSKSSKEGLLSY